MTHSSDPPCTQGSVPEISPVGRSCPVDYRYTPEAIAELTPQNASVLYVIGGLYGNSEALNTILGMMQCESEPVTLCFNGDFNWFNIAPNEFRVINQAVRHFDAIRGNVETELSGNQPPDDCGCAYPAFVDDSTVARSNQIIETLHETARQFPEIQQWLQQLPRYLRYEIGDRVITVVHGDPESLAGWGLCQENLDNPADRLQISRWLNATRSSVIASTHTCLPFLYQTQAGAVINNGASGMPGFKGDLTGLLSRISIIPPPAELDSVYGTEADSLHINAVRIPYAHKQWINTFSHQWQAGSPAYDSYYERLNGNIDYSIDQAVRWLIL